MQVGRFVVHLCLKRDDRGWELMNTIRRFDSFLTGVVVRRSIISQDWKSKPSFLSQVCKSPTARCHFLLYMGYERSAFRVEP